MKLQKNKIVFVLVMVTVVLFITAYSLLIFGKEQEPELNTDQIPLPDLEESPKEYESKLEALEAIKEEGETTALPMYPEHMIDHKGYFNPDYMEYEKHRIIDSVYQSSALQGDSSPVEKKDTWSEQVLLESFTPDSVGLVESDPISIHELALEHQLFFASHPKWDLGSGGLAHVDGDQVVKDGHRLALRLDTDIHMDGYQFYRGCRIYGFVKIRPNRVLLDIVKIGEHQVKLKAFDLEDGGEGIYVENQLRGKVVESGVDATLGDINIPGIPQVSGIKRIFQQNNRSIKVKFQHQYQIKLIQKP